MAWELDADRPIYAQLVERIQKEIVSGKYQPGEKLPSVRDLAAVAAVLPKEMELLVDFMRVQKKYSGSNTEFCERYNEYAGQAVSARGLKRLMNLWEYRLADFGVRFRSHRSNGARLLEIEYSFSAGDESAVGDG